MTTMTKAKIHYYDIGDYLKREEKLKIISKFGSIENIPWQILKPNQHGDWLNHRNDLFETFIPLAPITKSKVDTKDIKSVFITYAIGLASNRDAWVYGYSKNEIEKNMRRMIDFYNEQSMSYQKALKLNEELKVEDFIDNDPKKISWTVNLKRDILKNVIHSYNDDFRMGLYRPFCKCNVYLDVKFIERPGLSLKLFPTAKTNNLVICVSGVGASKDFSTIITDRIPDLQVMFNGQCFPLYYYEEKKAMEDGSNFSLFDAAIYEKQYERRDAISNFILERCRKAFGNRIGKEDIFYYVYGILHSSEYRARFASDLKKMLPRLPLVDEPKDFWIFSKSGRALAELHLNYESLKPAEGVVVNKASTDNVNYRVEKMRYPSKDDKTTIIYNHQIRIENIPLEAYEYVINGKSAIDWIVERYQVTINKDNGIRNDPNDWSTEQGKESYILDLLLSIIRLSLESAAIIKALPKLSEDNELEENGYDINNV